ncbi:MAG: lipoprotein signal peptidase [Prevotella sp.]|uniref:lipoprotein signal peptidase n=1 Tax=Prevotella sp. TaxID=59823 RepID=UPI002A25514C|nr:lipoprotein signal peptidase [Prevotella sp.]MDD7318116.1 lipoprotein signal peptidase [Prevotellaceae bacterium]MDY4020995.1 lipoprotein signal peptidase [Prevotella sp.]
MHGDSRRTALTVVLLVVVILTIDQIIKIEVKTGMRLHEVIDVTGWFKINFIENNGMAYGMTFFNKLALSLFRIVAISFIGYYLTRVIRNGARMGYIVCLTMVFAGAVGNMIDCMFYGLIFNASSPEYLSYFVPFGEGYAPFLMGKVVDMFYFPLIETTWPEWVPFVGGDDYIFFSPVFNFADASISVGVAMLLLFYRKELSSIRFSRKKG